MYISLVEVVIMCNVHTSMLLYFYFIATACVSKQVSAIIRDICMTGTICDNI